jgi:hypothetical protein
MPPVDHYAILGVRRTATPGEIRDAFRRIAWQSHPDRDPNPETRERFIEAAAAFEVLSDPHRRALYDLELVGPYRLPGVPRATRVRLRRRPLPALLRRGALVAGVCALPVVVGFADVMDYGYAIYALAVLFFLALARLSREL